MSQDISHQYYKELIDLQDVEEVEAQLQSLLDVPIESVTDLENWLKDEKDITIKLSEAIIGHQIDFYRNTEDADIKSIFVHDQQVIHPLLMKYEAKLNEKFCNSPYLNELDENRYSLMKRVRESKVKLFREENIPLFTREQELCTKYDEIMGGLTIEWEGEEKPLPFIESQQDHLDRSVREKAYHAKVSAFRQIKPDIDAIMDELVQLRHQIALNAGFDNYRDYMFVVKNREYSIQDCYDFHENVEKYIIPAWNRLADDIKSKLGVDSYRPCDVRHMLNQSSKDNAFSTTLFVPDYLPIFDEKLGNYERVMGLATSILVIAQQLLSMYQYMSNNDELGKIIIEKYKEECIAECMTYKDSIGGLKTSLSNIADNPWHAELNRMIYLLEKVLDTKNLQSMCDEIDTQIQLIFTQDIEIRLALLNNFKYPT